MALATLLATALASFLAFLFGGQFPSSANGWTASAANPATSLGTFRRRRLAIIAISQCHRSGHAWPARVANQLENQTTAVTFISYACSGADMADMTTAEYGGIRPGGDDPLEPQVVVARRLLGDTSSPNTRSVDVLLVGAGVNDLDFEGILNDCFLPHIDCRRPLSAKRRSLDGAFDALEAALSANLRVGHAYLAEYPNRVFTDVFDHHRPVLRGNAHR